MAQLAAPPLYTPSFSELAVEYLQETTEILGPEG